MGPEDRPSVRDAALPVAGHLTLGAEDYRVGPLDFFECDLDDEARFRPMQWTTWGARTLGSRLGRTRVAASSRVLTSTAPICVE